MEGCNCDWSINGIAITGILSSLLLLILFYTFNLVKEIVWDLITVSAELSELHFHPVESYYTKTFDYIAKITAGSNSRLFQFWSHVTPRFWHKPDKTGKYVTKAKGGPGYGSSFFRYQGYWVRVIRTSTPGILTEKGSCDKLKLSTFKWHGEILKAFFLEAIAHWGKAKLGRTTIYAMHHGSWANLGNSKPIRNTESVLLAKGQVEKVVKDVQGFFDSRKWYEARSIPHHRGYLLYGPPGCGKTSMIRAVAGEFNLGICSLSLSSKGLTDDCLLRYLNSAPAKTLILLEDVDCAFKSRSDECATTAETNLVLAGSSGSAVTFRGLLNALDGVASCDGKIVFMTTNHPEKLDPALTRPGRVDVKVFLNYPNEEQLGTFFSRFYPEGTDEQRKKYLRHLDMLEQKVSMAMVQGLFMMHKDSAQDAIDGCKVYFEEQFKILPKVNDVNANLYI